MKTGIELITQEREEQIMKHGRTIQKDRMENSDLPYALPKAAASLTIYPMSPVVMEFGRPENWDKSIWQKMCKKNYKDRLIIAGALIAAELDRIRTFEP
jgi:hypothetical protein